MFYSIEHIRIRLAQPQTAATVGRTTHMICSQLSPVLYPVRRMKETRGISVHFAHLKPYHPRQTPPAPQFEKLADFFLGKQIPLPTLNHPDEAQPIIESYVVGSVVGHKLEPGRKGQHNFEYRMRLMRYGPESDLEYRADEVPQCHA